MGLFGNNAALSKIDRDIAAIADGNADLAHPVGATGNDPAGRISANLNRFYSRIRGLIGHSRSSSVSIAADAARMNHLVQQTSDAVRRQEVLAADIFPQATGSIWQSAKWHSIPTPSSRRPGTIWTLPSAPWPKWKPWLRRCAQPTSTSSISRPQSVSCIPVQ